MSGHDDDLDVYKCDDTGRLEWSLTVNGGVITAQWGKKVITSADATEVPFELARLKDVARRNLADYRTADARRLVAEEHLAALAAELEAGTASDGYHTHRDLYEYRMLYNAHAAAGWHAARIPVVKSWHHHDGQPCFGGGWFVVVAELDTGQVSNHYAAEHWPLFAIPEVERPPAFDGHTPADAAARLRAALEQPQRDDICGDCCADCGLCGADCECVDEEG